MLNSCVKAVLGLGINGRFTPKLHTAIKSTRAALCVTSRVMAVSYSLFTSGFTLFSDKLFKLLEPRLMPTLHTANKSNEFLYKLIIVNNKGML